MIIHSIYFIFFSIVILISILGYGLVFQRIFLNNINYSNLSVSGVFGLFLLYIISSISHLFFAHDYIHNLIIHIFGIAAFIYNGSKSKIDKEQLKLIFIFFVVLFVGFLISKTNEDFPYYHLPNSLQFAENKLQFGLGNLNHGFKHFSSLFLINSLFYLPVVKYYLFNITNFIFQIFFFSGLIIFLNQKKFDNFFKILASLSIIILLSKFYRLSEYGSDIPGQFLVILSFLYCVYLTSLNKKSSQEITGILSIIIYLNLFAISTKFIYLIYLLIPVAIVLFALNFKKIILEILNIKLILLSLFSILFLIFFNFSSTGCLIYPIEFTCFDEKFNWSLKKDTVSYLNLHYEAWAKAGKGTGYNIENVKEYVKGLNWIDNWVDKYFFNKFSDYLLVILFILIVYCVTFFQEIKNNNLKKIKNLKFFLINLTSLIIIFIFWFLNFPTLRYAGYAIVFLLISYPSSYVLMNKIDFSDGKVIKKIKILVLITLVIFNVRNINRINQELNLPENQNHNFKNFPFYWVDDVRYEKVKINNFTLYKVQDSKMCWNIPSTCIRTLSGLNVIKKNGYKFYFYKK
tara:strand:+ start:1126 stop:2844 length:1719 start_codon:yes stop_codon:yes gene_type:complete